MRNWNLNYYAHLVKPLFDWLVSFVMLVILLPALFIIASILLFHFKGSPFFLQKRSGKDGCVFTIYKFRSMSDKRDDFGFLLADSERVSSIGRFVRKTSLDELPQLFNVLKGEMSIVGPRPLLPEYLALYNDFQIKRLRVKPGITGWAQVNGRNAIGWDRKFELDVWYAENISIFLDLKIVCKTIIKVLQRKGISESVLINMEPFKGNIE
jgi:lipopolysaccharide/colanic/teichoic acid biosynthesis glycosyltransferase